MHPPVFGVTRGREVVVLFCSLPNSNKYITRCDVFMHPIFPRTSNMHVVLKPSPSVTHKYRVILPSKRAIDFGQKGVQHYIDHGDARLMRAHLIRKGAVIPKKLRVETNQYEIHRGMLDVTESDKEDWDDFFRADYWERWMLLSYPDVNKAKLYMTMNKGILFMPQPEDLWFCKNNIYND